MAEVVNNTFSNSLESENYPAFRGYWSKRIFGTLIGWLADHTAEAQSLAVVSSYIYPTAPGNEYEQPTDAIILLADDCGRPHYDGETIETSCRDRVRKKWDFWQSGIANGMQEEFSAAGIPNVSISFQKDWQHRQDELLQTFILAANSLRGRLNLHEVSPSHNPIDTINSVSHAPATNTITLMNLVNEIKGDLNNHFSNTPNPFHFRVDGGNKILSPNCHDIPSTGILLDECCGSYQRHLTEPFVHYVDDLVHYIVSWPDPYWSRFFVDIPFGSTPVVGPGRKWGDGIASYDGFSYGPLGGTDALYQLIIKIINRYKPSTFVCWDLTFHLSGGFDTVTIQVVRRFRDPYFQYYFHA